MEVVLDKFGRIVIPKRIRDDLGLGPGTSLRIERKADAIILVAQTEEPAVAHEDGVLVFTGEPVGDLTDAVSREREERLSRLVGRGRVRS